MLFTDIVGSTLRAGRLGDRRWADLLQEHHTRTRRLVDRFRGCEVNTAGDGFSSPLTGPPGRSGAPAPSGMRCARSAWRSGPGCTPARSNARTGPSPVWRCTSAPESRPRPSQRGPGHQHRANAGARLGHQLHRPRDAHAQGRTQPMAAVRRGPHLTRRPDCRVLEPLLSEFPRQDGMRGPHIYPEHAVQRTLGHAAGRVLMSTVPVRGGVRGQPHPLVPPGGARPQYPDRFY